MLPQKPEKLSASWVFRNVASKVFRPTQWRKIYKLSKQPKHQRAAGDAQLKLYSDILPDGFIHLGYFDDSERKPEAISIEDFRVAQRRHAELVLSQLPPAPGRVLDVGCGSGGLAKLLKEKGQTVVGLTPDRYQVEQLREELEGSIEILHSKFEDIDVRAFHHQFHTVITSESLQYLDKRKMLAVMDEILLPGGRWIVCDYLRIAPGHPWSFSWDELKAAVADSYDVLYERDITAHILPTLKYVHMLGSRIAQPAVNFFVEKIRTKEPAVAYVMGDVLDRVQGTLSYNLGTSDPSQFASEKSYRLFTLQKKTAV